VAVSSLVELGGGTAGEFGRLFLSPLGQFSPAGGRCGALADFGRVLFSGSLHSRGREVVRPSGWPASSVASSTFPAGNRSPAIFPVTGISP